MMTYNVYVISADILTSMMYGAIAILLIFQLLRDRKTRMFLLLTLLQCINAASFALARISALINPDNFALFFYIGMIIYAFYPAVLLSFAASFFELWTPLKYHVARGMLLLPIAVGLGAVFNKLFESLTILPTGSFRYPPTAFTSILTAVGELCIFYTLILVIRHAYSVRMQARRHLIFGVMLILVTALLFPSDKLFRIFGAPGIIISTLFITGSVLRTRLFDPLTQLNKTLLNRTKRLRKAMRQNSDLLAQVQEANTAKTRFIAYISHEVRGSVSNIFTRTQMMTEHREMFEGTLPEDYAKEMLRIRSQADHLKVLINDLLDISRIEAGELKLTIVSLDPILVLDKVRYGIISQLQSGVVLDRKYCNNLPYIYADETRLMQIMMNLVGNAAKFTTCGSITLAVDVLENLMQFEVIDTGSGISEIVMSHLYQPYIQEIHKRNDPHRGTGLGLAISKHLIELHGGTIYIQSEVGLGTRVKFTIPLAVNRQSAAEPDE